MHATNFVGCFTKLSILNKLLSDEDENPTIAVSCMSAQFITVTIQPVDGIHSINVLEPPILGCGTSSK